jgi:hypothetical protein
LKEIYNFLNSKYSLGNIISISGAAISLNMGSFDVFSSLFLYYFLLNFGINLGDWFYFNIHNEKKKKSFLKNIFLYFFNNLILFINIIMVLSFLVFLIYNIDFENNSFRLSFQKFLIEFYFLFLLVESVLFLIIYSFSIPYFRKILLVIYKLFGLNESKNENYFFLSDGGHFDNLGIYNLLFKQCSHIYSFDATDTILFESLYKTLFICFQDGIITENINIKFQNDDLTLHKIYDLKNKKDFFNFENINILEIEVFYCLGSIEKCVIYYGKSMINKNVPNLTHLYSVSNPSFPNDSTINQFFDHDNFYSYKSLGKSIAKSLFSLKKN